MSRFFWPVVKCGGYVSRSGAPPPPPRIPQEARDFFFFFQGKICVGAVIDYADTVYCRVHVVKDYANTSLPSNCLYNHGLCVVHDHMDTV